MIRQALAVSLLVLCAVNCASSALERVIQDDLLIDISSYEPMRGEYDRYTFVYTPGDSTGYLLRNGVSVVTILSAEDVRWLAELIETELLTLASDDGLSCADCVEINVSARLGSRSHVARVVAITRPPAIQKLRDRVANLR